MAVPVNATTTIELPPIEISENTIEGNCYLFIKSKIPDFPMTKDIVPNSIYPKIGGVVIMDFEDKSHYAYIPQRNEKEGIWVDHTNFGKDGYQHTFFTWEYLEKHNARYWYQDS